MKKRVIATMLAGAMVLSMTACGGSGNESSNTQTSTNTESEAASDTGSDAEAETVSEPAAEPAAEPTGPVELVVTTTFAGEDTNAQNYKDAVAEWEAATGNTVVDTSATSNEAFKARVVTDFETGSEPDVLFFFNGADSNSFVEAGKVVPIDEIRAVYPEYAANMNDDLMPASLVDNKIYAVTANGYWEAMFFNTEILEEAGVSRPGADYTMDQFKEDCEKIKAAGYTPIAAALGNVPHYWWEFAIFNNQSPDTHLEIPENIDDTNGQAWIAGMNDIKELYELGYFPENTLSATDDETFAMFTDGKAAFLIDGSWKVGGIVGACQSDPADPSTLDTEKLDKFDVTYVPGKGDRKASDLIGGLSSGYFITRKAWEDPEKQAAVVSFVEYMTSDTVIPRFAKFGESALKNAPELDESEFTSLQVKAMDMIGGATSLTAAVQDLFQGDCRVSTFDGMPEIVTGRVAAEDAVAEGLDTYYNQ
ncbi:MAG: extracellular solute-binding protein [Lachnospiraceae bacterium]|nr:extracellular solute-binding protein [Lachnospiraceae bacterium]